VRYYLEVLTKRVRKYGLCMVYFSQSHSIKETVSNFQSVIVDDYLQEAQKYFGNSTGFVESLKVIRGQKTTKKSSSREETLREALAVCSCSYENNTKWGTEASVENICI